MTLIGLSGGIGAGKSTIASRFAEHGAIIIDADQVAREIVQPGKPAVAKIAEQFGQDVLTDGGGIDRGALAAQVFADSAKLRKLEHITHPYIQSEVESRIAAAGPNATVVYEVPLLIEANVDYPFDHIVMAMANPDIRMQRLITDRGMSAKDALGRISNQASDEQRIQIADTLIKTDGTLAETFAQVDELWRSLHKQ